MAHRARGSRILRPLLYTTGAGLVGSAALYSIYRPRDIPGLEAAQVPPPTYGEGGVFRPPNFPHIKSRDEQIADLKRSAGVLSSAKETVKKSLGWGSSSAKTTVNEEDKGTEEPYDLLVIGGGATGTGIALDAATRGLKVALVERDDFSSGTSSKSTKLVHGGVRYLEKAVWNLDYNQYDKQVPAWYNSAEHHVIGTSSLSKLSASGATSSIRHRIFHNGSPS